MPSSYPGLLEALVVPAGHGGWRWGPQGPRGPSEHGQPDAAGLRGAAVHPHRVLEAPVRPGRRGAWQHSSGHGAVDWAQIRIPQRPHGPRSLAGTHTLTGRREEGFRALLCWDPSGGRAQSRPLGPIHRCRKV